MIKGNEIAEHEEAGLYMFQRVGDFGTLALEPEMGSLDAMVALFLSLPEKDQVRAFIGVDASERSSKTVLRRDDILNMAVSKAA